MAQPKKTEDGISVSDALADIRQEIWIYNQVQGDPSLLVQVAGQNHCTLHEAYRSITKQLGLLLKELESLKAQSSDSGGA